MVSDHGSRQPDLAIHAARGLIDGNYLILAALLGGARLFWCWQLNHVHDSARRVQLVWLLRLRSHSRWPQGLQKLIHVFLVCCFLLWVNLHSIWPVMVEFSRKGWGWFSCCCWLLSVLFSSSVCRYQCWNSLSGVHQRLQSLCINSDRWPAGQCRVLLHSGTHICWKVQLILGWHKVSIQCITNKNIKERRLATSVRQQYNDFSSKNMVFRAYHRSMVRPCIGHKGNVGSHEIHRAIYKTKDSCLLNLFLEIWSPWRCHNLHKISRRFKGY